MFKKYLRYFLLIMILVFPSILLAVGNTWYVSVTGSDSNPGTFEEPLLTIQMAVNTASPLDTIIVSSGEYVGNVFIGKPVNIEGPNMDINPNSNFGSSRNEEAIINGTVQIASDLVTLNGMEIQNAIPLAINTTDNSNNLYLKFNKIVGFNEVFSFNYDGGLHTGITVSNWTCEGNWIGEMVSTGTDDPIMSLGGLENAYFVNNTFSGGRMGALQFARASSLTIEGNYFQDNNLRTGFMCFFDGENSNILMRNNQGENNSTGIIFYCSDNACRHTNVMIDNNYITSLQEPQETSSGYQREPMLALVSLTEASTISQPQFENFYIGNNSFEQDFSDYTSYEDPMRLFLFQGYVNNIAVVYNQIYCGGTLSNATVEVIRLKDVKGDIAFFNNELNADYMSYDGDSYLEGARISGGLKSNDNTSQNFIGNYFSNFHAAVKVNGPLPANNFLRVDNNNFYGNVTAILNEDTVYNVDARGNYWDSSDGPQPTGSGDPVSSMVIYDPFSLNEIQSNSDYVTPDYSDLDFGSLYIDFSNGTTGTGGFIAMAQSFTRMIPNTISRFWVIGENMSDFQCDLTFYYDLSDLPEGVSEEELVPLYSVDGGVFTPVSETIERDTFNHSVTVYGITHFSAWTLGKPSVVPVELSDFIAE